MKPIFVIDIPIDPTATVFMLVGKKIKQKRLEMKITQQQLASAVGIEKTNLSRIETGRTNPTLWTLLKLSHALEISLSELVEGIGL